MTLRRILFLSPPQNSIGGPRVDLSLECGHHLIRKLAALSPTQKRVNCRKCTELSRHILNAKARGR